MPRRNHNDEQPAKDYAEVITLMKWAEIEVYYAVGGTEDFGRDFALVDVGEKRWIVMEWIHSHHRGPVDECVFHDWADEKFHSRWTNLFMRACSYGQLVGLSDETIQRDAAE